MSVVGCKLLGSLCLGLGLAMVILVLLHVRRQFYRRRWHIFFATIWRSLSLSLSLTLSLLHVLRMILLRRRSRQLIWRSVWLLVSHLRAANAGTETVADRAGSVWSRPVVGIDSLEFAILHHSHKNTSIQQLGLLDNALHHFLVCGFSLRLDEANHGDVALDLNILAKIKPIRWRTERFETNFALLRRFNTGLITSDAVLVSHVDVEWRIDVRLQTPRHVVETAVESDFARPDASHSRHKLNALCDLVPSAVELIGGCIPWSRNRLVVKDQRIERNDFAVGVEDIESELARDEARDRRYDRKGLLFAKHFEMILATKLVCRRQVGSWRDEAEVDGRLELD